MTEAPTQEAEGTQAETEAPETTERTFTQVDLNKIAANEKREGAKSGKQAAIAELLQQTGAESIDDVLSAYTEYQSVQQVTETEADKARKRAERLETRAKTAEEQVKNLHREFALRDALRDSGINSARLPLALKVADMQSLTVENDTVEGVESVVEALQEASPEWFTAGERQRVNAPETSGGTQIPQGLDAQIQEAFGRGDRITAERLQRKKLQAQGKFKIGS